jgi:hypothetical protein
MFYLLATLIFRAFFALFSRLRRAGTGKRWLVVFIVKEPWSFGIKLEAVSDQPSAFSKNHLGFSGPLISHFIPLVSH